MKQQRSRKGGTARLKQLLSAIHTRGADGMVDIAIQEGVDFHASTVYDGMFQSPLLAAVMCQDKVNATKMVVDGGANLNKEISAADPSWPPLHWAAYHGEGEMLTWLLEKGADPNLEDGRGETALIYSLHDARTWIVRKLLAAGADPEAKDQFGTSALELVEDGPEQDELPPSEIGSLRSQYGLCAGLLKKAIGEKRLKTQAHLSMVEDPAPTEPGM